MPKWISLLLIFSIVHMQFSVCGSCRCACTSKSSSEKCRSDSLECHHSEHGEDSCQEHHAHAPALCENQFQIHSDGSVGQLPFLDQLPQRLVRTVASNDCQCNCPLCLTHRDSHIASSHLTLQTRQDHLKLSLAIAAIYVMPCQLGFDSLGAVAFAMPQPCLSLSVFDSLGRLRI